MPTLGAETYAAVRPVIADIYQFRSIGCLPESARGLFGPSPAALFIVNGAFL